MNIITKYVLGELLKIFLLTLSCLTSIMIIVGVAREAMNEGLGLAQIAQIMPYILPDALRYTIPATALFAASCVYGRLAGSNEVVALKSMGISPLRILWPAYVAAVLLSALTVVLNDVAVSWGRNGVRRVVIEAVEEIAYSRLRMHRSYSNSNFSINVKRVDGRRLIQPVFTYQDRDGQEKKTVTLRCEFAELQSDDQVLTLRCFNGRVDDGMSSYTFPDEFVHEIDLEDVSGAQNDSSSWSPSWMSLRQVYSKLATHEADVKRQETAMAAKAGMQFLTGDFDAVTHIEWDTDQRVLEHLRYVLHRLRTEPQRRWSTGFSCLCFVLVGSAVAIRRRHANMLTSFFICFLPILIVYYPLLAVGVDQAKSGSLPPETVWLGNVALMLWGAWELRRVLRY